MVLQLFDGYDLRSINLDGDFSVTWISVPIIRKGIEIKYISKDLYDFLDIPDWGNHGRSEGISLEKGMTFFLMLSDGNHFAFIRSSDGLYYERDKTLSEKLTQKLAKAVASGSEYAMINLNGECSEAEQLELIPPKQSEDILTIIKSYQDTAFA